MKKTIALAFLLASFASFADVTVSDVSARQRWPWNGLVDIDFSLNGASVGEFYDISVFATYNGDTRVRASTFAGSTVATGGVNRLIWNFGADCPNVVANDLEVQVVAAMRASDAPCYLVIDVSGGSTAISYPVRYTTTPPTVHPGADGSNDVCKTTEIWFRRIPGGTQAHGTGTTVSGTDSKASLPERPVMIGKDYYMAVFETTQRQWFQVMGDWKGFFNKEEYRDTRPVEYINDVGTLKSNGAIRGNFNGNYNWPDTRQVDSYSFIGKLRARSGLNGLDLPTEAQWEHAYRAGTTGDFYADDVSSYSAYGRYSGNRSADDKTATVDPAVGGTNYVGSYPPNPWGLYDMFGNVLELCLDQWALSPSGVEYGKSEKDPEGPSVSAGSKRVARGGCWDLADSWAPHAARRNFSSASNYLGFRMAVNLP